jgi:hypothetical protein
MTRSAVDAWKQHGTVYLWHYLENERNYPGWHFTADAEGVASVSALFKALRGHSTPAYRTVVVSQPTPSILGVPNNKSGAARWFAPDKWRITYLPDTEQANTWTFQSDNKIARLSLGSAMVPQLIAGVEDVAQGKGDYCIGLANSELWFWWHLHAA